MNPTESTPTPAPSDQPTPAPSDPPAAIPIAVEPVMPETSAEPVAATQPESTVEATAPAPPAELATPETPPAPSTDEPAPAPAEEPRSSGGPKRILLVEDDDSLANVYLARLQAENYDVRRVANGEEALAAALSYKPDIALLDVMMPKVSGFDVLDIMRNTPETANLKIIMLTALSQESDVERAKQLGVDEYLVKSQVVIADVVDRIKAHLGQV